jgi:hypothetical protein
MSAKADMGNAARWAGPTFAELSVEGGQCPQPTQLGGVDESG